MNKHISAEDLKATGNRPFSFRSTIRKFFRFFLSFTEADAVALMAADGFHGPEIVPAHVERTQGPNGTDRTSALRSSGKWMCHCPGPIPTGVHPELIGKTLMLRKQVRQ